MNELYFLSQILCVLLFSYGALRFGRGALITSMTLQAILANLFVLKQMTFLGFQITCADALAVGSVFSLNLLREYYGPEEAKKGISISFFFMVFFVVLSQLHIRFIPSPYDTAHLAYARLLTPAPRLLVASLLTFYAVQQLDVRLFGIISRYLPKSNFSLRSSISLSISQLVDTLLFSFIGLYGMVAKMGHIIAISFCIKFLVILAIGPMMTLVKKFERGRA